MNNEKINNLKNEKINNYLLDLKLSKNKLNNNQILKKIRHIINYANEINVPITPRLLGDLAVSGFNFRTVRSLHNEKVYLYTHGIYNPDIVFIDNLIDKIYPDFKESQLKDVLRHIRTSSKVINIRDINKDHYLIPCKNLIYDRLNNKVKPFSPNYFIRSKIATKYPSNQELDEIKDIYVKDIINDRGLNQKFTNMTVPDFVNDLFNKISNYDHGTRKQLDQELLDALEPNLNRGKCIINHGQGGCGKSSFTKLLLNIVGDGNYSSVDINELDDSNNIATMLGKTVNVGDDLSDKAKLFDNSNFKKITTNANLTINPKYQQPFSTTLGLTLIENENHYIKITGASGSLLSRRLLFVPFNHHFNEDDTNNYIPYDDLKTLLSSKYVREYVLYKVLHQPHFKQYSTTKESRQLLNNFLYQNNPVKVFFNEFQDYHIDQIQRQLLFNIWDDFAHANGFNSLNRTNFLNRFEAIATNYKRKRVRFTSQDQIDQVTKFTDEMGYHPVNNEIPEINHYYRCYVKQK